MDFVVVPFILCLDVIELEMIVQGVVGLVFGNENFGSNEDSYVERLLDHISNGKLAEDRRSAMIELQAIVAESRGAQLAFGAMGFPVMLAALKEERDAVEMVENLSSPYIFIPCFSFNFNSIT
ncbi:golgin candidate 6-like [Quercus suber]|uniref:golgin candidate 6-like n=1 Tax=Quercus suber TaxID=58331 RepID=UPI000D29AEA9|nr:golgin candidate 6 [Quercus suber]